MGIAWRELRRTPGRFVPVVVAMSLLVVLLAVLGGFLDGLERSQTGVVRAHEGRLVVTAADVALTIGRSPLPDDVVGAVQQVDGVAAAGRLATVTTTARPADGEIVDVVVVGYDLATATLPAPPADGAAHVDERLGAIAGTAADATPAVGPAEGCCDDVDAVLSDVSAGGPTVWVDFETWREVATAADPTSPAAVQAVVVEPAPGTDLEALADDVEAALAGVVAVDASTPAELIAADEVVTQQSSTFAGIIGVTFVVTLLVVGLFFVLLTIERSKLYAVLKAMGGRTPDLVGGLTLQAVVVAVVALVLGGAVSLGLLSFVIPADLPVVVLPERLAVLAGATIVVAIVGALLTLRRILRIDPGSAIG
jgi:putative ABC transport system permease protein